MRWLSLAASVLLPLGALAAKGAKKDTFTDFQAKQASGSPVKLDDALYKKLTAMPRDYTAAVLLTAMDARFGCQLCREFQPEWDLLAKSWIKGDKAGESRMLYGTLDFNDGKDTFMGLGLQTAPVLLLFEPTSGPHATKNQEPTRFDFTNGFPRAENIQAWVARHMAGRPQPAVRRPINWMRWISGVTIVLGTVTTLYVAWPYVLPLLQNRNIWSAIILVAILLFTSGHMFNHIRKVPYIAQDQRGGISYFANGFQNQYGLETQIVAAMYGLLSLATINLAIKSPRIANPNTQKIAIIAWGGILLVGYSFLLSVFRWKNGGYPFFLPPFV